jgi:transcriptional regulator with XRE-family HTH domain
LTATTHYVYKRKVKAEDLKARRERMGFTQAELARRLKVNVMTVSRWERGAVNIPHTVELALKEIERDSR